MEYRTLWGGVSVGLILRFYPERVETKRGNGVESLRERNEGMGVPDRVLALADDRDGIMAAPTGSPAEIVQALEAGHIDAALVTVAQSRTLQARGYVALCAGS
jgi:hypothetical protein